jgi:uncharacterized membrane protein
VLGAGRLKPVPATLDEPPRELPSRRRTSARTQVLASVAIGLLVGIAVTSVSAWEYGTLIGWDAACAAYIIWVWTTVWPLDAGETAPLAEHQDPTRATADLLLLSAAVASLVAVGFVLAQAAHAKGATELLRIGLGLASVIVSWLLVHTVFALRYARLYYTGMDGGVDFNQADPPTYRDFAYLSFTIGMTFQVSDTALEQGEIREEVLRHSLLSFVFATGIVATTINLVASLGSK